MAETPERKVKRKVTAMLDEIGAYWFYPVTSGYGSSGVPDIIACINGRFIGIECKANGGVPTALQERNLNKIRDSGGTSIAVDETGLGVLAILLCGFSHEPPVSGTRYHILDDVFEERHAQETD